MVFQVQHALADELQVREVRIDTRAILLSHPPAGLVHKIASEKRPSSADVRFMGMNRASILRVKENTRSIGFGYQDGLGVVVNDIGCDQGFRGEVKAEGQTMDVLEREYNAPLTEAALTAHAA
jgi:hypothetical protein